MRSLNFVSIPAGREGHRPGRHRREVEGVRLESAEVRTGTEFMIIIPDVSLGWLLFRTCLIS